MGIVNFAGRLPVALTFAWSGDVVADALSGLLPILTVVDGKQLGLRSAVQRFSHVIANELVNEFTINCGGSAPFVIKRKATPGKRLFDQTLAVYTTDPVPGEALDQLITEKATAACTLDLTFTYHTFFDLMLAQLMRTDAELRNVANPNDSAAILATFSLTKAGGKIRATYKSKSEQMKNIPCRLADVDVTPRPGKAPAVKLGFQLDLAPVDDVRREVMRKLIAMDWSKLVRRGQAIKPGAKVAKDVEIYSSNLRFFVMNHVDPARGERFRVAIRDRHLTKTPEALSNDLRNDIDEHLVTANHWGDKREDVKTERHQHILSNLFGTLHQDAWLASPVFVLRDIDDFFTAVRSALTRDQYAALALHFGAGHCGEHSDVSFSILKDMAADQRAQVLRVVKTGFANIDHAFVVYNLDVETVVQTTTTNSGNSRTAPAGSGKGAGKRILVWNLRKAIAGTAPREGFVMDPYLDQSRMKPKASDLIVALNNAERKAQVLDTDFLAFDSQLPEPRAPLSFGTVDFTSLSDDQRKRNVRNV